MSEIKRVEDFAEITSDQMAEECLLLIRAKEEEKKKWVDFYKERCKAVQESIDMDIAQLTVDLRLYFETVPHKVTTTQENYALPSGKLVFKQQSPEFHRDDSEVISWLKENGLENFIKVKESLDWDALRKTLCVVGETVADESGRVIPSITAEERPNVFKVELKKVKVEQEGNEDV